MISNKFIQLRLHNKEKSKIISAIPSGNEIQLVILRTDSFKINDILSIEIESINQLLTKKEVLACINEIQENKDHSILYIELFPDFNTEVHPSQLLNIALFGNLNKL